MTLLSLLSQPLESTTLTARAAATIEFSAAAFPSSVKMTRRAVSTDPLSGFLISRQVSSSFSRNYSERRILSWKMLLRGIDQAEFDALMAARRTSIGGTVPFTWTPPAPDDEFEIESRFLGDTMRWSINSTSYDVEIDIEEVV